MKYLSEVRQRLTYLISQVTIGDPVKSWIGLRMDVIGPNHVGWSIDFAIVTPNAQIEGQKIVISVREVIFHSMVEVYLRDHHAFYHWVYRHILKLLEHSTSSILTQSRGRM